MLSTERNTVWSCIEKHRRFLPVFRRNVRTSCHHEATNLDDESDRWDYLDFAQVKNDVYDRLGQAW